MLIPRRNVILILIFNNIRIIKPARLLEVFLEMEYKFSIVVEIRIVTEITILLLHLRISLINYHLLATIKFVILMHLKSFSLHYNSQKYTHALDKIDVDFYLNIVET